MGSVGPLQIVIVLVVAVLVFGGRGRISSIMGDVAKGIRSFRTGLNDPEEDETKAVTKEDMVDVTPAKDEAKSSS
ncbi:MAG: twin-arginine translocase TatA/TatE family subunit [Pseudomonadota bacterium]